MQEFGASWVNIIIANKANDKSISVPCGTRRPDGEKRSNPGAGPGQRPRPQGTHRTTTSVTTAGLSQVQGSRAVTHSLPLTSFKTVFVSQAARSHGSPPGCTTVRGGKSTAKSLAEGDSNRSPAAARLCGPGQITAPPRASVSSPSPHLENRNH